MVIAPVETKKTAAVSTVAAVERPRNSGPLPTAVVLTCAGAGDGALGVVRALGEAGVRVVLVSDEARPAVGASRHCQKVIHAPHYTTDDQSALERLIALARAESPTPVLFPTADPDLLLAMRLEPALRHHYRIVAPPRDLAESFMDKRRFHALAGRHGWPIPKTITITPGADAHAWSRSLRYPAIVKPATPRSWTDRSVQQATGYAKAVRVDSERELLRVLTQLAALHAESLVQEFVVGPDEEHVDVHALLDPEAGLLGWFTGRKIRVFPAGAGAGCYVESVILEDLLALALRILGDLKYTGLANINFKRDVRTGKYMLFEVNPRVSAWNILDTRCGVDLPLLAYLRSAGRQCSPAPRQRTGMRYVHLRNDLKSFAVMRRSGECTLGAYGRSLLYRPLIHQVYSLDDPMPAVRQWLRSVVATARRLREAVGRLLGAGRGSAASR